MRRQLNPDLRLTGFVLCAYDARTTLSAATEQALQRAWPDVPAVRIPAAVAVTVAPGAHQLVVDYAPLSPAALATRNAPLVLTGGDR